MPVEVATYINQLDPLSPAGTDPKSQGDDHLRTIKSAVKQTFPNAAGAVNASHVELNHLVGVASAVQPQIDLKASKTGDSYTGIHDFALATSVKLPAATTIGTVTAAELGYLSGVTSAIQSQFGGVNTALAGRVSRSGDTYTGSHVMTGAVVTVVTQPLTDKSTKAASTKHVDDAITAAALSLSLPGQSGNAGKYLSTDGANAGWASAPVVSVMGRSGVVTGLVEGSEGFTGKDANTVVTSVIARMDGATNGPPGFGTLELYASRHSDTAAQIAIDHLTGRMAYRSGYGIGGGAPVWKPWAMSMNASEIPTVTAGVIDCSKGSSFYLNMTGNTSLSLINAPANTTYSCELEIMHSSGSFVLPANASWSNGAAPEFMQGKAHLIYFRKTNTSPNFWLMSALPNY